MAEQVEKAKLYLSYHPDDQRTIPELAAFWGGIGFQLFNRDGALTSGGGENRPRISIAESHFFIACMSKTSYLKEPPVREEIEEALRVSETKIQGGHYFIVFRLKQCAVPDSLEDFPRENYFEPEGLEQLTRWIKSGMERRGIAFVPGIRSRARSDLSVYEAVRIIRIKGFFHKEWNDKVKGFGPKYDFNVQDGQKIFVEQRTGLMWQRYVSNRFMEVKEAKEHVKHINEVGVAGYKDWRLPTLDEAMTLMQKMPDKDFFVHPAVHDRECWILTADEGDGGSWVFNYNHGICRPGQVVDGICVRAVREMLEG
jgi:hypothetical protein